MAIKNVGATLKLDASPAIAEVEKLYRNLSSLADVVESLNNLQIKFKPTTIIRLKSELTQVNNQVNHFLTQQFARSDKYIKALGDTGAKEIKSQLQIGTKGIDELVKSISKLEQATKSNLENTFRSYKGGYDKFLQDINKIDISGIQKASNEVQSLTQQYRLLGRQVSQVGRDIQNFGRTTTRWGRSITQLSVTGIRGLNSITSSALRGLALMGYSAREVVGDAIDEIKDLEYAQVGLRNQFSIKEEGFDVSSYMEQIKETARKTMGLGAGDLATYISQVVPASENSTQAFNATMGLLKSIAFSGGNPSEDLGYIIRNIRDVMAKGQAYQMDINQFNRAIPGLPSILERAGLNQYVQDGQLNITEENVGQLMAAFASLNSKSSPVYGILDEMNRSLGGLIEESKETITQSVAGAIEDSGLLDAWKDILDNKEITNFIQTAIRNAANGLANIISKIDGNEVLKTLGEVGKEVGKVVKDEVIPALKNALGLDDTANLTAIITELIRLGGEFIKGLASGIKFTLDTFATIRQFGSWLKSLGLPIDNLVRVFGWLVSAGWAFGGMIQGVGKIITSLGKIVYRIGRNIYSSGTNGGLLQNIGSKVYGSLGNATSILTNGVKGGSSLLGSLGIIGIGHSLSGIISEMFSGGNRELKQLEKNALNLASTFAGVTKTFGPVAGVIASLIEGLKIFDDGLREIDKERKESRERTRQDSLNTLRTSYIGNLRDMLRSKGLFSYEDDNSEDALSSAMARVQEFGAETDPQKVMTALLETYMNEYTKNVGQDRLTQYMSNITDDGSSDFIAGKTSITTDYANSAEGTNILRNIYNALVQYGKIEDTSNTIIDDYTGEEIYKRLLNFGYNFTNLEQLLAVYNYLPTVHAENGKLRNNFATIEFVANNKKLSEDVKGFMNELGFEYSPNSEWGTEAEVSIQVKEDKDQRTKEVIEKQLGISNLQAGKAYIQIIPVLGNNELIDQSEILSKALDASRIFAENHAMGGLVKPIYRASGGDVPAMGVDTVPAMLSRGEFVQKASAVRTSGLGVMEALNRGDLRSAYNLIGAKISGYNRTYNNSLRNMTNNSQRNYFVINNNNRSATRSAYFGMRNRLTMR